MNCEQVAELLDAYALGAAEQDEAAALEEHVADCVRCWSALNEAQRVAATIALSTAIERAPESLRARILEEAAEAGQAERPSLARRLRSLWPIGAGILATTAAASLVLAVFAQAQVSDLRSDNDELAFQVETANERLTNQQQLMTVLAAPDVQNINLQPTEAGVSASAVYYWSGSAGNGAVLCNNLPPLKEGQVYQVWFITESGESHSGGTFTSWDGVGQVSMDLRALPEAPVAIAISLDKTAAVREPEQILLRAEFPY